jgi:hypothetical protein
VNKLFTVGLAAVFAAGFANAQNGVVMVEQVDVVNVEEAQSSVDVALVSSDVWRGQVRNEDFVFQPQFTIAQYGVSFNVWANYDFSKNYVGVDTDIGEIDLSLAYTIPVDLNDFSFDVGIINYQFPANGYSAAPGMGTNSKSTSEIFGAAHWLTFRDYVLPSVTVFGDIQEVKGQYVLFDFVVPYQISEYLYAEVGASTGYGTGRYNSYYFPSPSGRGTDKGFDDYNFFGTVSYELLDGVTASLNLTYTGLYGGQIKENAKSTYEAGEKFWGGVNLGYDF